MQMKSQTGKKTSLESVDLTFLSSIIFKEELNILLMLFSPASIKNAVCSSIFLKVKSGRERGPVENLGITFFFFFQNFSF